MPRNGGALVRASLFELSGDALRVWFSSDGLDGVSHLTVDDESGTREFHGREIRTTRSEFGELHSVTLDAVPELEIVTLTLILPAVSIPVDAGPLHIEVLGIITTSRSAIAGPPEGAASTYRPVVLAGDATHAMS